MTTGDNSTAVIFASNDQLELLHQAHVIYMDSTFKVVPSLYYQLFTVFVPHADYAFPVFFALMTRKTMKLYEAVMLMMHHLAPEFQTTQVIADFEEAPTAAVRAVFGNDVTVSGCWFHYAQALVKRMCKVGLANTYQQEDDTQTIIRCLLALPLLPVGGIIPGFEEIKALLTAQSPSKTRTTQLFRYVERQWLNKANIGPSRLSVRNNPSRTNNVLESFYSALRHRVKIARSSLFSFLGHLQRTTTDNQADIGRLNNSMAIRRPKNEPTLSTTPESRAAYVDSIASHILDYSFCML